MVIFSLFSKGKISTSDPPLACSAVRSPPNETDIFFALVDRGNCTFAEKVSAVQNAKFFGAIIINVESDYVFPMGSDESNPSVSAYAFRVRNYHSFYHGWAYIRRGDTHSLSL